MPNDIQQKEIKSVNLECKFDTEKGLVIGYASIFNNVDDNEDIIRQGAFTKSINSFMPPLLWQHNIKEAIGKPIVLKEDSKGLYIEAKLTKGVPEADKALLLVKDGVIDSFSFGYTVTDADYENGIRIIKEVKLHEISLVTFPCNKQAKVIDVKSEQPTKINIEEIKNIREAERVLKNKTKGLTREEITGIVSKIKDVSIQEYLKENKAKEANSEMQAVIDLAKQIVKIYE